MGLFLITSKTFSHPLMTPNTVLSFTQVTAEQNGDLLRPFSKQEIHSALFAMSPDKAPGPDGMNPKFFQQTLLVPHW